MQVSEMLLKTFTSFCNAEVQKVEYEDLSPFHFKTVKSLYSLNKICLWMFIYTFSKVAHLPLQKVLPRQHLDSCRKRNPRESFKYKRKGNNYFLHLKHVRMLHEGN